MTADPQRDPHTAALHALRMAHDAALVALQACLPMPAGVYLQREARIKARLARDTDIVNRQYGKDLK